MTEQTVRPLPGSGVVARIGGVVLACDTAGANELIALVQAALAGDGGGSRDAREVTRRIMRWAVDRDAATPCALAGPTAQGGVAVLAYGAATVEAVVDGTTVALSGAQSDLPVTSVLSGTVARINLRLPGAGAMNPLLRLDAGVVSGGGAEIAGMPTDGVPSAGRAVGDAGPPMRSTPSAPPPPTPASATPAPVPPVMKPHPVSPAAAAAALLTPTEPASYDASLPEVPRTQAPPVPPHATPPPRTPSPPEAMTPAAPVMPSVPAGASNPSLPHSGGDVSFGGDSEGLGGVIEQAGAGGMLPASAPPELVSEPSSVRFPNPAKQFDAVLLIPDPRQPSVVIPPEPEPVLPPRAMVPGVACARNHFNKPGAPYCQVCGIGLVQLTQVPVLGTRPPLGVLILDNSMTFQLDEDYIAGREPQIDPDVVAGTARPLIITDTEGVVSRRHARIHLDGWEVDVIDLGSANGTFIQRPGRDHYERLGRNATARIQPGTKVVVGRRQIRFESHLDSRRGAGHGGVR